jgi:hypothetical protein
VRDAIHEEAARAADALAAVGVERDGILAGRNQPFVDHVEHLQKRHVWRHLLDGVIHEPARRARPGLPPHF